MHGKWKNLQKIKNIFKVIKMYKNRLTWAYERLVEKYVQEISGYVPTTLDSHVLCRNPLQSAWRRRHAGTTTIQQKKIRLLFLLFLKNQNNGYLTKIKQTNIFFWIFHRNSKPTVIFKEIILMTKIIIILCVTFLFLKHCWIEHTFAAV